MKEDENKKLQSSKTENEPPTKEQEKVKEATEAPAEKNDDDEDTGYVVMESGLGIDE